MYAERLETGAGVLDDRRQKLVALQRRIADINAEVEESKPRLARFNEMARAANPAAIELADLDAAYRREIDSWVQAGGEGEQPSPLHAGARSTLQRKAEAIRATVESAQRAAAEIDAQNRELLNELARLEMEMIAHSAVILAAELTKPVESARLDVARAQQRHESLIAAAQRIGDIARRQPDEGVQRALLMAQNKLLVALKPIDLNLENVKALGDVRSAEDARVRKAVDDLMSALKSDPHAVLDLGGDDDVVG